jgi:Uma2 family endonuclease
MLAQKKTFLTRAEYLRLERAAETRHELVDGEMAAVSGASLAHNEIVANLISRLVPRTRKNGCRTVSNDLRIKVSALELYTYPDVVIFCGAPRFEDGEFDTLLNPRIVIEVLSPSTENYDRGYKSRAYRMVDSLEIVLLIAQDVIDVEVQRRGPDRNWSIQDLTSLDDTIMLFEGVELRLSEIYEGLDVRPAGHAAGSVLDQ